MDTLTKTCTGKCGLPKPIEAFSFRRDSKDGRQHTCKACVNAASTKWRLENGRQREEGIKVRKPKSQGSGVIAGRLYFRQLQGRW